MRRQKQRSIDNMSIKDYIKDTIQLIRIAKETYNKECVTISREIIRMLWKHRHTNKTVSAVIVAQQSRAHMVRQMIQT